MEAMPFHPPGPGSWDLETTHVSRPITRYMVDIWPSALMKGFAEGTRHYGLLLDYLEFVPVNGFIYGCRRIVGAPKEPKGPPPRLVFKLLTWFHPETRRRLRRSKEVFEKKVWREDLARWDAEWKPAIKKRVTRLQAVDPSGLATDGIVQHLSDCRDLLLDTVRTHHRLNPCYGTPLGDFIVHASEWTDTPQSELMQLFQGASRVSLGGTDELQALGRALSQDEEARTKLASREPAQDVITGLLEASPLVASAMRAYLDVVGYRVVTGYDVSDLYSLEIPEIIVSAARSSLEAGTPAVVSERTTEAATSVRDRIPAKHRPQFDELLEESRLVFRVRDERVLEGDAWATGLTRRALLAAGDRLAQQGKIEAPGHAVDATHDELLALLQGHEGPDKAELTERVHYRTSRTIDDAPPHIGPPPAPPPPLHWLPPQGQRAMRAVGALMGHMFETADPTEATGLVKGIPVSPGQYEGTARLVLSASDMGRIQKGDVLVAKMTAPSYGIVLPLVGAIVTDRGGLLSHPALVAREYGLPAVVGANDATKKIADGSRILVDGTRGEVSILP